MSEYNPFGTSLANITATHLGSLRAVHEGWYVEYKSEVPNASSIAKSISAFSNTYGGWLFYGVSEKSKAESVAGEFKGIERDSLDAALQKIRQACATSVNPTPHFDVRAIWGPDEEIGLQADRCIICIEVPKGRASPYVHASGTIYRRVGDGSEPKPETDRFMLDQLWRRSEEIRKEYRDWVEKDLPLTTTEKDAPFVRIFISPDLWRDKRVWADLNTEMAREIFSAGPAAENDAFSTTAFETVHRTSSGFIGRQVAGNNPQDLTATWFLRQNLTSEIVVPLPFFTGVHLDHLPHTLDGYENADEYCAALRAHGHRSPKIVDLNFLFATLNGIFHIQSKLDAIAKRSGPLYCKAQLINVWRARPFLDVKSVVDYQLKHGVPVCMDRNIYAPFGTEPDDFTYIADYENIEVPAMRKLCQAINAFDPIAAALGIETGWDLEPNDDGVPPIIHTSLIAAGQRAMIAQTLRGKRQN